MNRKTNTKMIIIIIAVILTIVGIGVIFYLNNRDLNKPEDVLKQYVAYINEQKYEEMYEMLSEESKNQTS